MIIVSNKVKNILLIKNINTYKLHIKKVNSNIDGAIEY